MRKKSSRRRERARKEELKNGRNEDVDMEFVVEEKTAEKKDNLKQKNGKSAKKVLDFDDNDENINLNINSDYAKRFDHNKERMELEKLESKYGDEDLESDSESDEEEDDIADLVTEDIENGIQKVLKAIRENPKSLLDPNTKFFNDPSTVQQGQVTNEQKPMHLKDYHRRNLLDNSTENEEVSLVDQEMEEKNRLVNEIHGADDEDDEEFLTKRTEQRKIEPIELPDPDKNEEAFLEAYINNRGWVPTDIDPKTGKKVVPTYEELVEEDSDDFDDIADKFETAYNFRYEDPNAAEIVSYARSQNTLRRQEQSSRKRQREKKKEAERERENKRKEEIKRLKNLKVKEVMRKFEKLKEALGDDEDILSRFNENDLDGVFDETEWDKKMQQVFNDEFYAQKDDEKPDFDENMDEGEDTSEIYNEQEDETEENEGENGPEDDMGPSISKKKQKSLEKARVKAEKQHIRDTAEKFVDDNIDLVLPDNIKESGPKFKYRQVEPDSFGLTARDILLADDKDLNQYVGLKKLATFRDKEKVAKDRKKYAKKKRLKEWRKAVFDTEEEPDEQRVIEALTSKPVKQKKQN